MNVCKVEDCGAPRVGRSQYCREHRSAAREAWKARIQEQQEQRVIRNAGFADAFAAAMEAGFLAGRDAKPPVMVVVDQQRGEEYAVPEGPCGFAWVTVRPGNCAFANWLKACGYARKDSYAGGVKFWVNEFGQSYTRKAAFAKAMAETLQELIPQYDKRARISHGSRLD